MKKKDDDSTVPTNPFMSALTALREGDVVLELGAAFSELVAMVKATRKPGTLTLKIVINAKGEQMIVVADKIDVKPPEHDKLDTLLYVEDDNTVSTRDPRQPKLIENVDAVRLTFPAAVANAGDQR